eukprot:4595432-Amphidinium_carterae.4
MQDVETTWREGGFLAPSAGLDLLGKLLDAEALGAQTSEEPSRVHDLPHLPPPHKSKWSKPGQGSISTPNLALRFVLMTFVTPQFGGDSGAVAGLGSKHHRRRIGNWQTKSCSGRRRPFQRASSLRKCKLWHWPEGSDCKMPRTSCSWYSLLLRATLP